MVHISAPKRLALGGSALALLALAGCDLGEAPTTYPGTGPLTVVGDFDGDGNADILTRTGVDGADVLFGDGTGAFTNGTMTGALAFDEVRSGDANGDGYDDLFVVTRGHGGGDGVPAVPFQFSVVLNQGGTGFGAASLVHSSLPSVPNGFYPIAWSLGDVDGNGISDLIVTVPEPSLRTYVHVGDGTGGYGAAVASSPTVYPVGEQQSADLDGDGHEDLVVAGLAVSGGQGAYAVFWGNGTAALGTPTVLPSLDWGPSAGMNAVRVVEIGDYDGDGDLDIVGVDRNLNASAEDLAVLLGDGARGFAPAIRLDADDDSLSSDFTTGDVDGDGFDDLVDTQHFIRFGEPSGQFTDSHFVAASGRIKAADLDADGKPDLVASTPEGTQVFMNRWEGRPE